MGDISIIARRLKGGYVQYGWSGNGGYFSMVGLRLLSWYQKPEDVEYLFELGQTRLIGKKGSEEGGSHWFESHDLTGEPFWLGTTERKIFSKIVFIDYGYFYDLDSRWYYIIPGPFRIKMPLVFIGQHLDKEGFEFKYRYEIEDRILRYILTEYHDKTPEFREFLEQEGYCPEEVMQSIKCKGKLSVMKFYEGYQKIFKYFDDWVLIKADETNTEIREILVKKKEENHVETNEW